MSIHELTALPRDRAAERGEARPSFNLASYVPAINRAITRITDGDDPVCGISFDDADGKTHRFRLPLAHARNLLAGLAYSLQAHSDRLSGKPMRAESSPSGSDVV